MSVDCPIVKEIDPARLAAAGITLDEFKGQLRLIGDAIETAMAKNLPTAFNRAGRLHYLSVCVIDDSNRADLGTDRSYPPKLPPRDPQYLSLELSCDGSQRQFLTELANECWAELDPILRFCVGYGSVSTVSKLVDWLEKDAQKSLFYVANAGRTRERVFDANQVDEHELLERARQIALAEQQTAQSRIELWRRIRKQIRANLVLKEFVDRTPLRPLHVLLTRALHVDNFTEWIKDLLLLLAIPGGIWGLLILFLPAFHLKRAIIEQLFTPALWPIAYAVFLFLPLVVALISFADCLYEGPRRLRLASRVVIIIQCLFRSALHALFVYLVLGVLVYLTVYLDEAISVTLWILGAVATTLTAAALIILLRLILGYLVGLLAATLIISMVGFVPAMWLAKVLFPGLSPLALALAALALLWLLLALAAACIFVAILVPVVLRTTFGVLRGTVVAIVLIALFALLLVIAANWLQSVYTVPSIALPVARYFIQVLVPAVLIVMSGLALILALRLYGIRQAEKQGPVSYRVLHPDHMDRVRRRENKSLQNHFASITDITPGRLATLEMTFRIVAFAHKYHFNAGYLARIPSIHFARWLVLPDRKRMAFLTNYDFDFAGYLGDFQSVEGVTGIWSNSVGFPRGYMWFWDGSRSEQLFKNYARNSQVESLIWFSAYPNLTVQEVDRATAVREALKRPADDYGQSFVGVLCRAWNRPLGDAEISRILREELQVR